LRGLDNDAVVITGDFRNSTYDNHARAVAEGELNRDSERTSFGILGNHDFVEQAPELESLGFVE
jgi:hypothetical protein